ncbi:amidohydrolase family protein [Phycisphaerales bacterium AB-hyl4]|uniref:Amidohydrolase family protein n=1 Tax=Natronomicrosphaera hydrolytica TaxID=3242702 RepID=A0ABV4UBP0_9BACT
MTDPIPTIIDVHAMLGVENHLRLDADALLEQMDRHGITAAITRPMGRELVWAWREGNDARLRHSEADRLRAWVTANPWAGNEAIDELRRCADRGAAGLFLHPARQGFMPIESVNMALVEQAASLNWPVMMQAGTYVYGDILAMAEVARRFPQTSFILGGGGFTDMWFEVPDAMAEHGNLLLETSLLWGDAILELVNAGFGDRLLFGSGAPRNHPEVVLNMLDRLDLPDAAHQAILGGNAQRVLTW